MAFLYAPPDGVSSRARSAARDFRRCFYAKVLYSDAAATLDDLREAVLTLEEIEPTARRVFGGSHPLNTAIESDLRNARAALRARETPSVSA